MALRREAGDMLYRAERDLLDWMRAARIGDAATYARGIGEPDAALPVVALVERWRAERIVVLERVAIAGGGQDGGGARHVVRRVARPRAASRIIRDAAFEESDEGRLFLMLVRHANMGAACPSLAVIAERLELRDRHAANYLIGKLVQSGRITQVIDGQCRVVTICETGRRTAGARDDG